MKDRVVEKVVRGQPTTDGAGVKLLRSLGTPELAILDPFLMLDEFYTDRPEDYLAGFPDHPHRGFETVTYMVEGSMEHRDSTGNCGLLVSGSVQWMTAGRGIIHSEMPKQERGAMRGFQLWVNLPAKLKMSPPRYQDIAPDRIPEVRAGDARVRVLAGRLGEVRGPVEGVAVAPTMLDVRLPAGGRWEHELPTDDSAFLYVFEGSASVAEKKVERGELAVLGKGDRVVVSSDAGGRMLLLAARPLREPVARYGPFVMSTPQEIQQAILDYREGRLA